MTAERSLADADDGFEPEEIEQSEFDSIWARARSFLDEKQMGLPDRP